MVLILKMEYILLTMLSVLLNLLALSTNISSASTCPSPRCSNTGNDDAKLCVPALIRKYNYPVEVHHVTTSDGYILELHRIPHGRDNNTASNASLPVALMVHGLFCSSAVFVIPGPEHGCAYQIADAGFDVWLANLRGSTYSRCHTSLNPNSVLSTRFWEFSWEQNGVFDLTAIIDYILKLTNKKKLHYIGHSMGTTSFFVMASLLPEYNLKISSANLMAPIAYMGNNSNLILKAFSAHANTLEDISLLFGKGEYLGNPILLELAGQLCREQVVVQPICSNILFLLVGWNKEQYNATLLPIILGHTPAGASVRQLAHYGQLIDTKDFCQFDYGNRRDNIEAYGTAKPAHYNLTKVTAPVFLHYSDNDNLASVPDVLRTAGEISNVVRLYHVPIKFGHGDYLWGINATTIYNTMPYNMRAVDNGEETIDENTYSSLFNNTS